MIEFSDVFPHASAFHWAIFVAVQQQRCYDHTNPPQRSCGPSEIARDDRTILIKSGQGKQLKVWGLPHNVHFTGESRGKSDGYASY
jgi:hypothetical protein